MDITKYEILLSCIETGSISATAEQTGYTQSGLSHMLNSLEDELGVKLITRNRNGVRLTADGEILLPYISEVVSGNYTLLQAVSEVSGVLRGKITIGSMDSVSTTFLPEVIRDFKEIYPNIEIYLKNGSYDENEDRLLHNEVDFGFILMPTSLPYVTVPVIRDRIAVICGKDYDPGFADPMAVTEEELARHKIASVDGIDAYEIIQAFPTTRHSLQIDVTTNNTMALARMLQHNPCVGVLPSSLAEEFLDLLDMYELAEPQERVIAMAYQNKKSLSPVARKFVEFIENRTIDI